MGDHRGAECLDHVDRDRIIFVKWEIPLADLYITQEQYFAINTNTVWECWKEEIEKIILFCFRCYIIWMLIFSSFFIIYIEMRIG